VNKQRPTKKFDVFGELTFEGAGTWSRRIEIKIFGQVSQIRLCVEFWKHDFQVDANQILAYQTFKAKWGEIPGSAERALYQYYRDNVSRIRSSLAATATEAPLVSSAEQFFQLVKPYEFFFPPRERLPIFGMLCECTWDNLITLRYEHGQVTQVGDYHELFP
jgi:hypothetical protein